MNEDAVANLHDNLALTCDELVIVEYLMAQGDNEAAGQVLEGALAQL